eukprot:g9484.t1
MCGRVLVCATLSMLSIGLRVCVSVSQRRACPCSCQHRPHTRLHRQGWVARSARSASKAGAKSSLTALAKDATARWALPTLLTSSRRTKTSWCAINVRCGGSRSLGCELIGVASSVAQH